MGTLAAEGAVGLPARRGGRLLLRAGTVAILAFALLYAGISAKVAEALTHPQQIDYGHIPAATIAADHEDVAFVTADGLTLRGWLFQGSDERAVVLVHGLSAARNTPLAAALAKFLLAADYTVLTFDLRGHGESDIARFSLGQYERLDVAAAIDFLVERGFEMGQIALIGHSLGAGSAIQVVDLRPEVGPIISDSSYVQGRRIIEEKAHEFTRLPTWFNPGIILAAKLLFGLDVDVADPSAAVAGHSERAILFIHCADDTIVSVDHSIALHAHTSGEANGLWTPGGCDHVGAAIVHPAEYASRVLAFLEEHIPQLRPEGRMELRLYAPRAAPPLAEGYRAVFKR